MTTDDARMRAAFEKSAFDFPPMSATLVKQLHPLSAELQEYFWQCGYVGYRAALADAQAAEPKTRAAAIEKAARELLGAIRQSQINDYSVGGCASALHWAMALPVQAADPVYGNRVEGSEAIGFVMPGESSTFTDCHAVEPSAAVRADDEWRIAEHWSSGTPGKKVRMLAEGAKEIAKHGSHPDFIRWVAAAPAASGAERKVER